MYINFLLKNNFYLKLFNYLVKNSNLTSQNNLQTTWFIKSDKKKVIALKVENFSSNVEHFLGVPPAGRTLLVLLFHIHTHAHALSRPFFFNENFKMGHVQFFQL